MRRGIVLVIVLAVARPARADFPPITNRDFAIDLYQGVPLGSGRVVSMGGAGAAVANGSSGTLINVSAPAVRDTTDTDSWSWDVHLDWLDASLSSDYANTGLPGGNGGATLITGGLALRFGDWAGAVTTTVASSPLEGAPTPLDGNAVRTQLALAKWFGHWDLAIGVAVQNIAFEVAPGLGNQLFDIDGTGVEVGATWIPRLRNVRIGANGDTPIAGTKVSVSSCDPTSCQGFILPDKVDSPWRVAGGAAYRFGPTRWNQLVPWKYRDERALILALDATVTGSSADAFGLQAFGQQLLQRSGRHASYSVRGGAEYEAVPGVLRVRAGSYWEPARLDDTSGRMHATFGAELAVFHFQCWGPRRFEINATGDVATNYRNVGLSIGLWH